ncbi:MAG TPA: FAD-dependent oxidoreductase, partial [Rhizomicrobium sp.]|nr:FAD-dependent oxidoreductase [Rhizomicrobium sp.]
AKYIAMMPQWDFLDFLAGKARQFPNFRLLMQTEAKDLLIQNGRIAGVLASGSGSVGEGRSDNKKINLQIRADLTIAADGRGSILREKSGLTVNELGAPFDVLWLRLPAEPEDPEDVIGRLQGGQMFVMIWRGDYYQCALVIAKGGYDAIRADGLSKFRARLKSVAGFAAGRVDSAITDFDQVKLLTVAVNRLEQWARPGLVCIGDAAHAMSPVGGVGINLAIQDAVATANILGPVLQRGVPKFADLKKVQRRREFPTRVIQAFQLFVQNRFLAPNIVQGNTPNPPFFLKLVDRWPWLQQFPARFIGLGPRPEHVQLQKR